MVYKKKTEKIEWKRDKNIENPSNFKLDSPNCYKYSLVPSQELLFQRWVMDWICALTSVGVPNL